MLSSKSIRCYYLPEKEEEETQQGLGAMGMVTRPVIPSVPDYPPAARVQPNKDISEVLFKSGSNDSGPCNTIPKVVG